MTDKIGQKVYVAMSGGVDSSVAAAILKDQGYAVTGVFMKFWSPSIEGGLSPESSGTVPGVAEGFCLWKKEREDALRVAIKLGIPLLTWDFTQEYEKKVVAYMLEAYRAGITPNPDIMCNKEIKFGMFFDQALAEGADLIATGHYARTQEVRNEKLGVKLDNSIPNPQSPVSYQLLQAVDFNKDQSYFLYTLDQRHLAKTLFPIGQLSKPEVRVLAKKYGLATAEKKDSQGVCFIGPLKMKSFLKEYIKPSRGKVVLANPRFKALEPNQPSILNPQFSALNKGAVIGEHDGVHYYTIGQRHGIDLKLGGGPYYVTAKDVKNNVIYVGGEESLMSDTAIVSNIHWIGEEPELPVKVGVKIRYRAETIPATLETTERNSAIEQSNNQSVANIASSNDLVVRFDIPVRAVTPGQAAVFYDGNITLGGGVFC